MKKQIRMGVFETNSSMTHALTMCTDNEYQKWVNGEVYWQKWCDNFITIEKAKENFERQFDYGYTDFDEYRHDEGILTYEEFDDYDYIPFETFGETYTTPSGEIVHAFGYYGHD